MLMYQKLKKIVFIFIVSLNLLLLSCYSFASKTPGLANTTYLEQDLFTQVSFPLVDNTTGLFPSDHPGRRHYGVNVMTMLNGYMVGVFAPDGGAGPGGWIALDVSDIKNITRKTLVYEPLINPDPLVAGERTHATNTRTANFRESHSFGLSEGNLIAIQTGTGIEIWDWSDIDTPIRRSKLAISGVNFGDYNNVSWQLFWQAPYLYIGRGNSGLTIVDTTHVDAPVVIETFPTSVLGGFNVGPIFALGNEMYISSMETTSGFSILNISDPVKPTLLKTVKSIPRNYYSSCWDGEKAYFGSRAASGALHVYDTTAEVPTLINSANTGFVNLYCNLQDDKLFLGNQENISALDVTTVADGTMLTVNGEGSLDVPSGSDHGQVFPFGNLVWVGNDHGNGSGFLATQTAPDTYPPQLGRTIPEAESTHQSITSRIGLALSDSVLMETVNARTFSVYLSRGDGKPLAGTYSVNLGFVNFSPAVDLFTDEIYTVEIEGIEDVMGNAMPAYTYQFSTGKIASHDISISADTVSIGQVTNFSVSTNAVLGGPISYSWDYGDGQNSDSANNGNVGHIYSASGRYTATLTVVENHLSTKRSVQVTVYNPHTATAPTTTSTIIAAGSAVIAVNEDNNSVTAINNNGSFTKIWETEVGTRPRTLAEAPNGDIWVINQESDSISILSSTGMAKETIALDRASQPYGIVFTPDGYYALISLQGSGYLLKLNASTGVELGRVHVGHSARGIAVDSFSSTAYTTIFISPQDHALVVPVNIENMTVASRIRLDIDTTTDDGPDRSRGIANYLNAITISPDGKHAVVPSNKANVDRGVFLDNDTEKSLTFETTVRAIVSELDLDLLTENISRQLDFDNRAQPKAIVYSEFGDYMYIAIEGQNSVEIIDVYDNNRAGELENTGLAPRGLVKNDVHLFVHNFMSRSITVYQVDDFEANQTDPIFKANINTVSNEILSARVLAGKKIFYNAKDPRMSKDGYLSCASCHTGGDSDGRVWDFTDRGEGLRNTISLLGRHGTGLGNVHWTANFDEIQDFENDIRNGFGGRGFINDAIFPSVANPLGAPKSGLSESLDDLAFYVQSLNKFSPSPMREQNGDLTSAAKAGEALFTTNGCVVCHSGEFFTDNKRHDVGTIQASSGQGISDSLSGIGFDTPTLIGLFETAPYFHNGQAATLNDVLQTGTEHTVDASSERENLVAYLEQIEYAGTVLVEPPAVSEYVYLSDLTELPGQINGWGPIEKDTSNGEDDANDGNEISIGGTVFQKGLGVHAYSEITYDISDHAYTHFSAIVGLDDENSFGELAFEVMVDGISQFTSGNMTNADGGIYVNINVEGANELRLIVTDGGNGIGSDHADWADAKLLLPSEVISNTVPSVDISASTIIADEGSRIVFIGTSTDAEDGNLSSLIQWSSDLDGSIAIGSEISVSNLTVGTHTISAVVTDQDGLSNSASVVVTIEALEPSTGNTKKANGGSISSLYFVMVFLMLGLRRRKYFNNLSNWKDLLIIISFFNRKIIR
jgi:PKD repeat protein